MFYGRLPDSLWSKLGGLNFRLRNIPQKGFSPYKTIIYSRLCSLSKMYITVRPLNVVVGIAFSLFSFFVLFLNGVMLCFWSLC